MPHSANALSPDSEPDGAPLDQGPTSQDSTEEILAGISPEDLSKFELIYARIAPALLAWATLRVPSSDRGQVDPEEVVQEVWCRALSLFHRYSPERCPFRAWIFRIAKNVMLESYRTACRGSRGSELGSRDEGWGSIPDEATSVTKRLLKQESLGLFLRRLSQLSADEKELLIYCGLESTELSDAAMKLGLSRDACAKRWQRLKKKLREWGPTPAGVF